VTGSDELPDADARAAVRGILDAFFGDLLVWARARRRSGS
jgi:hypothetical protein